MKGAAKRVQALPEGTAAEENHVWASRSLTGRPFNEKACNSNSCRPTIRMTPTSPDEPGYRTH